jgi:hypothetical protein
MLDLTWVIGLMMSNWDLIRLAAAVNHRTAAPWCLSPAKWLCGFGDVFLDEVGSYMGNAARGTHRSSLRVMTVTENQRTMAGWRH